MPDFAEKLLEWYFAHARQMPWRIPPTQHAQGERADPYHVWLSEIMLQQTQVATVRDYFLKFVANWPTVKDLAETNLDNVLKAWAGLGYYSRARNLKKCAELIMSDHGGSFPQTYEDLKKLPGIGDYTASAIASIAFDQPVPVIDGNVERVMARHYRIEAYFPDAKPETRELLREILAPQKPGEFAQAMMDLGATICTPKRPACGLCPIAADCLSAHTKDVETYPRKKPKAEKKVRVGAVFILENDRGEIFLTKRPERGLLGGMTQVPTTDWTARQDGDTGQEAAPVTAGWKRAGTARHTFTHFHLELTVWHAAANLKPDLSGWWCQKEQLDGEALPKVMRKAIDVALSP